MFDQHTPIHAAIDIGSNTLHLVVARCLPDDLEILADEVDLVRIGESVTATGDISSQKQAAAIDTLLQYKAIAQQHQASPILVVATEAIRQAKNSTDFLAAIQQATGLTVHLIDGNVEATLTFAGATYMLAKQATPPNTISVMDLGGGSTELVTATRGQITWRTSLPIGSGWLHDRSLPSNPPTHAEIEATRTFLHDYLQKLSIQHRLEALIVTGGSANSLLHLAHHAFGLDLTAECLTHEDVLRCEGLLHALPAEEITKRYQQPAARALILPAGAAIIRAVMAHLHLNEIHVSPHGIREGALLAYARYGAEWLTHVQADADSGTHRPETSSTSTPTNTTAASQSSDMTTMTFRQFGRHLLRERLHKMLSWREAVLHHEDSEDVHKMRVATRRLRAALDAYAPLCEPTAFRRLYRQVKKLADVLGEARDTDVMLQSLQEQLARANSQEQSGIAWLIQRLHSYRQQQQEGLAAFLHQCDEEILFHLLDECLPKGEHKHGKS